MGRALARMEEDRSVLKIVTENLTGEVTSRKTRHRLEVNMRIVLKEIGENTRNWIDSTCKKKYWIAIINAALNLRVR